METTQRNKMLWRIPLVVAILFAMFWGAWYVLSSETLFEFIMNVIIAPAVFVLGMTLLVGFFVVIYRNLDRGFEILCLIFSKQTLTKLFAWLSGR